MQEHNGGIGRLPSGYRACGPRGAGGAGGVGGWWRGGRGRVPDGRTPTAGTR
ncbi:MAG: hypothetical protein NCW75_06370 [Phycisphaera sp.]|nr:MAG: hypothetical protein NCW75_06370 [Phycisphaera sp.]